jgi:hypothetical protein
MTDNQTDLLSGHAMVLCGECGETIWDYRTPNGNHVALDNAVGPYVINGPTACRRGPTDGYRGHWDHCKPVAASHPSNHVSADEFLWP